jgi:hypothetical protein
MRFQCTGSGTLTKLELLFDDTTPSGSVRLGVYADATGVPGSLLLDAGGVAVANGWVGIGGLSLSVSSGSYYRLVFNMSAANSVRYITSVPTGSHAWRAYTYGPLPMVRFQIPLVPHAVPTASTRSEARTRWDSGSTVLRWQSLHDHHTN